MNLILIDSQLMWDISLFSNNILNFSQGILVEKTALLAHCQAERLCDWVEIPGESYQRRMTGVGSVNLAVSLQDSVSSAQTESKSSQFSRSCTVSNNLDE
jgi:hypothetical protein